MEKYNHPRSSKIQRAALKLLGYEITPCGDHWHIEHNGKTVASTFTMHGRWTLDSQDPEIIKQLSEILGSKNVVI